MTRAHQTRLRRLVFYTTAVIGLSLALVASPCYPNVALLVTSDICADPNNLMTYLALVADNPQAALFILGDNGALGQISTFTSTFDDYADIIVSAHGSNTHIGPFLHDQFVNYFTNYHPTTPSSVSFVVCFSASPGPNNGPSLIGRMSQAYVLPIATLQGTIGACSLSGAGSNKLLAFEVKSDCDSAYPQLADRLWYNINTLWSNNYGSSNLSAGNYCRDLISKGDRLGLQKFLDDAALLFGGASIADTDIHNYRDAVALNYCRTSPVVCGPSQNRPCN